MTYVLIGSPFNIYSRADTSRITVQGYTGNIYGITNKCLCTDHTGQWIAKHSLTTKTTSQAQTIVNSAIAEYNNDLPLVGSRDDEPQSSVTLE
jgi:hypothetical protein